MFNKNINNKKLIESLRESLLLNSNAQDYVENEISKAKDILQYNEDDSIAKENLDNLNYIKFTLKFLEDSYNKSLKGLVK